MLSDGHLSQGREVVLSSSATTQSTFAILQYGGQGSIPSPNLIVAFLQYCHRKQIVIKVRVRRDTIQLFRQRLCIASKFPFHTSPWIRIDSHKVGITSVDKPTLSIDGKENFYACRIFDRGFEQLRPP
jgi:hypothetical protein